jgi:hypothetical protein
MAFYVYKFCAKFSFIHLSAKRFVNCDAIITTHDII